MNPVSRRHLPMDPGRPTRSKYAGMRFTRRADNRGALAYTPDEDGQNSARSNRETESLRASHPPSRSRPTEQRGPPPSPANTSTVPTKVHVEPLVPPKFCVNQTGLGQSSHQGVMLTP
ncbi:hypothetical protein BV20DRAFT_1058547 [Pilatotrama ljubarskyi]|nr:hypothetical protein BV20DRAFT_1058547 [Pilatotrama ljubarskyi]